MLEILGLVQGLETDWEKTGIRRLGRIAQGMLAMSGRVTMLGISRWSEAGGVIAVGSGFSARWFHGRVYFGYFSASSATAARRAIFWLGMKWW